MKEEKDTRKQTECLQTDKSKFFSSDLYINFAYRPLSVLKFSSKATVAIVKVLSLFNTNKHWIDRWEKPFYLFRKYDVHSGPMNLVPLLEGKF